MNCRLSNPIRGRINAWAQHAADKHNQKAYGRWKQKVFEDLPDSVVELGPGIGVNLPYYRRGTLLTAIEPNLMMLDRLRKNAQQRGIDLDIRESKAEELDLADESAIVVVSTQVLCSVDDLNQVLNEVYRILRTGGRFVFLEHIAAPKGTLLRRLQDINLIRQPWRWCFEGCRLNRETDSALQEVGFSKIEMERFEVRGFPKHYIAGIATK